MSRRDFIALSGALFSTAALGSMLTSCYNGDEEEPSCTATMDVLRDYCPEVSSIWVPKGQQDDYYDSFKQMIGDVTDFSWLKTGDKVLLKLALNSGIPYPMTTDPWLLKCMIKLLKEKGANVLVGDQSGAEHVVWTATSKRGSSRELCQNAGLYSVITDEGATPCFFEEKIDEVGYNNAYVAQSPEGSHHWNTPVYVTSVLNEVDHIIYLPRVASHLIAGNTSGMKVCIGFLRDDSRLDLHQGGENFYAMYEEISSVPLIKDKLRLIASSGRVVLRSDGPDQGNTVEPDYGLVFASTDLLAHEILGYAWLEANNHVRSEVIAATPTFANNFLISFSFQEVEGFTETGPDVPEFIPGDIYCHPAVVNFLNRKGGRPIGLLWNQVNQNPDTDTVDKIIEMINPA